MDPDLLIYKWYMVTASTLLHDHMLQIALPQKVWLVIRIGHIKHCGLRDFGTSDLGAAFSVYFVRNRIHKSLGKGFYLHTEVA